MFLDPGAFLRYIHEHRSLAWTEAAAYIIIWAHVAQWLVRDLIPWVVRWLR